jgi:transcriptional regulator with XRE-family HTH domain
MKLQSSHQNRKQAGIWLRELREKAGLTQLELARRLRFKYYAFVSQVETGVSRVPTEKMEDWAIALGVSPSGFARRLTSFYEPELHRLLYEAKPRGSTRSRAAE